MSRIFFRFTSCLLCAISIGQPLAAFGDVPATESKLRGSPTLARLSDAESSDVLNQATQMQLAWRTLTAEFDLVESLNVSTLPKSLKENWPALVDRGGSISGNLVWYRDSSLERVDVRYPDVHPYAKVALSGRYLSRVVVAGTDKTTTIFPDSKQVLLTWPMGLTVVPAPADWLLPGTREDFDQLRAKGAKFEVFRADSDFVIRYSRPITSDEAIRVDVRVDPRQRYAVTEWQSDDLKKHVAIEYVDSEAGFVPRAATCQTESGWSSVLTVRSWQSQAPDHAVFQPAYPAGGLLSDATVKDQEPELFSIGSDGQLSRVTEVFRPIEKPSKSSQAGVVTGVAVVFIGMMFLRMYWAGSNRR